MKSKLNVALLQIPLVWQDANANLERVERALETLDDGVDLVVLPEMFNSGFTMETKTVAETMDGNSLTRLKALSKEKGLAICASLIISEGEAFFNRFVFVANGEVHSTYDKRHLFRMADEHKFFSAGISNGIHEFEGWRLMNRVCYDLRFPVWSRSMEVDLQIYVANWPQPRVDAWSKLLMARAIENQCYVIGVNRIGLDDNGIEYNGRSIVIDPKGNAMTPAENNSEGWIFAALDSGELQAFRTRFPLRLDADSFSIDN